MRTAPERAVLAGLLHVRDRFKTRQRSSSYGICWFLDDALVIQNPRMDTHERELIQNTLDGLFREWPKFSGSLLYPVPHPDHLDGDEDFNAGYYAGEAYDTYDDIWSGAYGNLRRELLDFMIVTLEGR